MFQQCYICYEKFDVASKFPMLSNCGHTICKDCLINLKVISTKSYECPLCKKRVKKWVKNEAQKKVMEGEPVNCSKCYYPLNQFFGIFFLNQTGQNSCKLCYKKKKVKKQ